MALIVILPLRIAIAIIIIPRQAAVEKWSCKSPAERADNNDIAQNIG